MAKKSRDKCIFFDKSDLSFVSRAAVTWKLKCAGVQTQDAIELESYKHIHLVPLMPDEDKTFSGSLVQFGFENLMTSSAHTL